MLKSLHTSKMSGLIAIAIAVGGLLAHPDVLGLLPEKWAIGASTLGIILQAITKNILSEPNA